MKNTLYVAGGQGARAALQALFFVLVARGLGVRDFGAFAGVVAFAALLAPFGSLGTMSLMVKNISRGTCAADSQLANTLFITIASGAALTALLSLASIPLGPMGVPWTVVALVSVGDLLGARVIDAAAAYFQASELLDRMSYFLILLHGARVVGAITLTGLRELSLVSWATMYCACSLVAAVLVLLYTLRAAPVVRLDLREYRQEWRDGLYFAVGLSSQNVYNDIDKVMLSRIGSLEANGVYSAAYRIIDMAFVPVRAVLAALYARFFREGANGLSRCISVARRIMPPTLLYAILCAVAMFALADFLPLMIGNEFAEASAALRGLAIIPVLRVVHYFAADSLTGAGHQGARTAAQIAVAILNVTLNAILIPALSWQGAVIASIASDLVLACLLWLVVGFHLKRPSRLSSTSEREVA